MSRDFEIHNLSNLTEEELWESVDELKSMVEGEIEYRKECAEEEKKITIPTELWVENKCYPKEGERSEDNFCEIVNEVEGILESYFRKDN